jgi:tripartite-type tricarboxylate transporter receptor subunit TctC
MDMKRVGFVATLAFVYLCGAQAETYPSRPITLVVGFAAGGPSDSISRVLIEPMRKSLGQPIIIENTTGAGGAVGILRVVRSPPDGYTVNFGNWTSHVGAPGMSPGQFDVLTDLRPVARAPIAPLLVVGRKTLPANNMRELITWLKANPGKATGGIVGFGSASHVSGIDFQSKTGTNFQFVPYRGGAPAIQDLLSGQIDLRFGTEASTALPYLRSNQLKAYAVLSDTRWSAAPDVPTIEEAGVPGVHISLWHGVWVPKNTPDDVIARLNTAVVAALADPAARERFAALGMTIPLPGQQTPEALGALHRAEIEKWWPIIKAAGVKAE